MSTKDFSWDCGPDPSHWHWEWDGYRSLVLPKALGHDEIIAKHYGNYVRIYAAGKALGVRQQVERMYNEGTLSNPIQLVYCYHLSVYEEDCTSWREGIIKVESWLDEIGLWGTPDRIEWQGLLEK